MVALAQRFWIRMPRGPRVRHRRPAQAERLAGIGWLKSAPTRRRLESPNAPGWPIAEYFGIARSGGVCKTSPSPQFGT